MAWLSIHFSIYPSPHAHWCLPLSGLCNHAGWKMTGASPQLCTERMESWEGSPAPQAPQPGPIASPRTLFSAGPGRITF